MMAALSTRTGIVLTIIVWAVVWFAALWQALA